jgi:NIPSNAP
MSTQAFYELRLYQVQAGRMEDMVSRWFGPLATLFQRHQVKPLACWHTVQGPRQPVFVYLMRWESMRERDAAWGSFYSDPEWQRVRTETNRGSELVERYELNFLRATTSFGMQANEEFSCQELYLPDIEIGASAEARRFMAEQAPDLLQSHGGTLLGAFEFMTGNDLPRAAIFLGWRNSAEREAALECLVVPPLGRADRYLLQPLPHQETTTQFAVSPN